MMPPRPAGLRLVGPRTRKRMPTPPLGLPAWSAEAAAVAVLLDAALVDVDDPASVASQVPLASSLPPATTVFLLGGALSAQPVLRWLGRTVPVRRATRCAALISRGYVEVGAALDEASRMDLAWGFSSPC
jgi:hypothetical protein